MPEVQAYARREWRGVLLSHAFERGSGIGNGLAFRAWCIVLWLVASVANLALLPLFAILPLVETLVHDALQQSAYSALTVRVEREARRFSTAMMHAEAGVKAGSRFSGGWANRAGVAPMQRGAANGGGKVVRRQRALSRSSISGRLGKIAGRMLGDADDHAGEDDDMKVSTGRKLHLIDLYLMRTPSFKILLRMGGNVALIIVQQITNPAALQETVRAGSRLGWTTVLLWAIGGCFAEYRMFAPNLATLRYELLSFVRDDSPSQYRSDVFNITDLLGYHLLLVSLLLPSPEYDELAVSLWSVATVLAWLRMIRLLELDSSLGPVVIMGIKLIGDVVKLGFLIFFVLCALVSGTSVIFSYGMSMAEIVNTEDIASNVATARRGNACLSFVQLEGSWEVRPPAQPARRAV